MSHTGPSVTVRPAERDERHAAAQLLATAFMHDPLIVVATDAASDPRASREAIFGASIVGTLQSGGELVLAERAGAIIGAALIADPQRGTAARAIRSVIARLISGVRFLALAPRLAPGALQHLNDADLASRRLAPENPHHVLVAVGVTESARGLGVGRQLVEHAVARAWRDRRSWGVRLETENPGNVDRYARWGFTSLGVVPLQHFDVHVMAKASGQRD
ncbi:MAG: GNAT family N-acetyltransferase [Microcella sp.]|uniref:GNAT family N-acetyltransferase n=1 Tax=Microcella sp. TaxID=1913979 RepID=UPI0024CD7CA7|nr:GNAT family N-acetyltransferase [Microcella sp.]UYN82943.1 MAG: GNAT family N-acetyltransferase [Microcella sp.]